MWNRILCAITKHKPVWVYQDKHIKLFECERCHMYLTIPSPELLMELEMGKIEAAPYLKDMARRDVEGKDKD